MREVHQLLQEVLFAHLLCTPSTLLVRCLTNKNDQTKQSQQHLCRHLVGVHPTFTCTPRAGSTCTRSVRSHCGHLTNNFSAAERAPYDIITCTSQAPGTYVIITIASQYTCTTTACSFVMASLQVATRASRKLKDTPALPEDAAAL